MRLGVIKIIQKRIKITEYARQQGLDRQTVYRMWRKGEITGIQLQSGTILIDITQEYDAQEQARSNRAILYSRVSSSQNKDNLETQSQRLQDYAAARGYEIVSNIKEIGSGLNDNSKKLLKILQEDGYDVIIVENKDRLTRFGFNYIETLLNTKNKEIVVINHLENDNDLLEDLVSIITSFCARIYGQRRSKRKTEKIIHELQEKR